MKCQGEPALQRRAEVFMGDELCTYIVAIPDTVVERFVKEDENRAG